MWCDAGPCKAGINVEWNLDLWMSALSFPIADLMTILYPLHLYGYIYMCNAHCAYKYEKKHINTNTKSMSSLPSNVLPAWWPSTLRLYAGHTSPLHMRPWQQRGCCYVSKSKSFQSIKVSYVSTHSHKCTRIMIKQFTNKMAYCVALFAK